jgi:hypothetical protein
MPTTDQTQRVERSDIEAKLRQIRGQVDATTERAKPMAIAAAGVGALAVIALAYIVGRRRGRQGRTVVEIRRV